MIKAIPTSARYLGLYKPNHIGFAFRPQYVQGRTIKTDMLPELEEGFVWMVSDAEYQNFEQFDENFLREDENNPLVQLVALQASALEDRSSFSTTELLEDFKLWHSGRVTCLIRLDMEGLGLGYLFFKCSCPMFPDELKGFAKVQPITLNIC